MYEYKIAQIFSKQERFFQTFSSCNRNFTIIKSPDKKLWCGECEKCCFVFLILSAHLKAERCIAIF
jgi:NAD-dependent dihydropyrimidine dehydrogenase PreA subunit